MSWRGDGYTPSHMAADISSWQQELPAEKRCKRQNIEQLLEKDFSTTRYMVAMAHAMGTTAEILQSGSYKTPDAAPTPSAVPINLENNPEYPCIRRVTFKLSAGASGFGIEYRDEEGPPIAFQRQWYERRGLRPHKLFAVSVSNGSMEPGLHDGDTVVVNTESDQPKDGIVFAVNYEGELVIKRLVRDTGQWWLSSDNPDQRRYPRKMCDEHCVLIGEIVHKQSERI